LSAIAVWSAVRLCAGSDAVLCGSQYLLSGLTICCRPMTDGRLEHVVHQLALGGRPAARFAQRLMLPLETTPCSVSSADKEPPSTPPSVIGIDDKPWRRKHHYGTR